MNRLFEELTEFNLPEIDTNVDELEPSRTQAATQDKRPQNPFSRLPASERSRLKPLMLTLHCLFPNELLPALDILDRGLVRCLVQASHTDTTTTSVSDHAQNVTTEDQRARQCKKPGGGLGPPIQDIFLVTSASAALDSDAPSATTTYGQEKSYEVRLHAWNCTCSTFTLSAFRDLASRLDFAAEQPSCDEMVQDQGCLYPFGGTLNCPTDRMSPPICKHVLACILFARCPKLFRGGSDGTRVVSLEELAGWCAGWGG